MRLGAVTVIFGAALAAALLVALAPTFRATRVDACSASSPCVTPTPPPSPTPTPVNAVIGLDPAEGGASVGITVTGQLFLPNEPITLYWDDPSRVAGSTTTDTNGTFKVVVKAFPGDQPGVHHLVASVPPNPRATFTLDGPPSPTPPASPSPSDSPSPAPSPTDSPTPNLYPSPSATPVAAISGIDVITRPPFVFLPIIGLLGLLGVIAYWALGGSRGNRTSGLPPATVVHRSIRPDYGAPYGAPAAPPPVPITTMEPGSPAQPPVEPPSAPPPPPVEPQAAEPPPPVTPTEPPFGPPIWPPAPGASPEPPGAPDAPPDLPQPSD